MVMTHGRTISCILNGATCEAIEARGYGQTANLWPNRGPVTMQNTSVCLLFTNLSEGKGSKKAYTYKQTAGR